MTEAVGAAMGACSQQFDQQHKSAGLSRIFCLFVVVQVIRRVNLHISKQQWGIVGDWEA